MTYNVNFDIELKKNSYPGLYIALEGIDGSGKTTQVELLAKEFEKSGKTVIRTHEPRRDGVIGDLVQNVLKEEVSIPEIAVQYLFAAQRAVHLEEVIIPGLQSGAVIISDRCFWSSIPYGMLDRFESGREESPDQMLSALSILSMYHEFIAPDISVLLDVSVETASKRLGELGRKAELYEKAEKLNKIKNGYEFLMEKFPDALTQIDGDKDVSNVTSEILSILPKK
ncbi:MAG: dTMP kinase [Candidatus Levybacteria bacterium]|nr:dTMP kinase [Candidatus Levybacteria bacterium]